MHTISLKNLEKAAVLAALYNASKPLGRGHLHYDPSPMTVEEARTILKKSGDGEIQYLKGRVMKIDLSGAELETWLYDRDNGEGAAEKALKGLLDQLQ